MLLLASDVMCKLSLDRAVLPFAGHSSSRGIVPLLSLFRFCVFSSHLGAPNPVTGWSNNLYTYICIEMSTDARGHLGVCKNQGPSYRPQLAELF